MEDMVNATAKNRIKNNTHTTSFLDNEVVAPHNMISANGET